MKNTSRKILFHLLKKKRSGVLFCVVGPLKIQIQIHIIPQIDNKNLWTTQKVSLCGSRTEATRCVPALTQPPHQVYKG